eukprot:377627-Amphidinium_carterae.1
MGRRKFTGHSLRVTGAQFLASQGLPVHLIQLQARWASTVVYKYVQDSPVSQITESFLVQSMASSVASLASIDEACANETGHTEKPPESDSEGWRAGLCGCDFASLCDKFHNQGMPACPMPLNGDSSGELADTLWMALRLHALCALRLFLP